MPETTGIPAAGTAAPKFKLPSSTGETIDLDKLIAKGPAVLFFYPKADTSGCTKEACGFNDALTGYKKAGIAVVGISPDPVKNVQKFSVKFSFAYPLLADEDHAVCQKYGVWQEKSMYGRKYWGVARTTFLVGKNGKILHVFEKVKPEGHDVEVMAWIKENL